MSVDAIGNFLTHIRNGIMISRRSVVAPYSKIKFEIVKILKTEGFIRDFSVIEHDVVKKDIQIDLKYVDGESVIHEITRESTPGRRVYAKADQIELVIGKLGISILTTNQGIMSNKKAKELSIGGEVICSVW
jgi:small subunit ribosomal protein S8